VDRLVQAKEAEKAELDDRWADDETIRLREELAEQIRALSELKAMAESYGYVV
jgi:formate C-acetyltransferase